MNFTDVLRRGFAVQWSEGCCSDCKRSGGNGGSFNNKFIYFCSDKQHSKACDNGFGAGVGTLLVVAIVFIIYHRRNKKYNATSSWISQYTSHTSSMNDIEKEASYYGVQTFSYNELQKATNNFDSKKEVGDGGFGTVYQGKLRDGCDPCVHSPKDTLGYVDPKYHECYQLTDKSDDYSFGVVLIELIWSNPAMDITRHCHEINLSNMAINKIQNHELHELVDPCLGFNSDYKVTEMIKVVAEVAFQCLQNNSDTRTS
ncbi:LEAF RUST 10 DISEASE-RESISTANCE LOCUS RECEPTOR-LIKE PROTEIN KINASE-like 1.2 [Camellia lanceoleosa]|uniref:LEAF RUST 10 DISEASE-RESISTANCE LOCUS RECEPTOR-LIKE PROTEIN KINASE-like 1.2 n=1 Tax=Camellia lanceoleosa TaxID=1840588 RepID=A0ACC0FD58_9ERIC|nr:LEAF RUST 10 DISEASE-RESISTANCE LOCUS RECEPTOR-LIKE PROTEIN KINASE-like 1.2 [Camellia lanceoleosa]